ncbi:MAG: hypothetical protein EOO30_07225 [Comamonadaceae bacterium]|nr:MAG: hypothetical protein EOO30_07225 [Comamonadaceae bacterium]
MTSSARSARLVSGVAALAVAFVALGAAADAWLDSRHEAPLAAARPAVRPAADGPVEVVRVPGGEGVRRLPTACRGCEPRMQGSRL